jgi:hypothetical protein
MATQCDVIEEIKTEAIRFLEAAVRGPLGSTASPNVLHGELEMYFWISMPLEFRHEDFTGTVHFFEVWKPRVLTKRDMPLRLEIDFRVEGSYFTITRVGTNKRITDQSRFVTMLTRLKAMNDAGVVIPFKRVA